MNRKKSLLGIIMVFLLLYIPIIPVGFWVNPPTGSMNPTIGDCDILLYAPGEPEVNDIMFYQESSNSLIIHRIVDTSENGYVFKGDNNDYRDGVVSEEQIVSEVYYSFDVGISESSCVSVFGPIINTYEELTGNTVRLSE